MAYSEVRSDYVHGNLPDDEELTPSIEFLTGDNAAITMTVDWLRCIQINA